MRSIQESIYSSRGNLLIERFRNRNIVVILLLIFSLIKKDYLLLHSKSEIFQKILKQYFCGNVTNSSFQKLIVYTSVFKKKKALCTTELQLRNVPTNKHLAATIDIAKLQG